MLELQHFRNDGFGWVCIRCSGDRKGSTPSEHSLSRVFREGEAESKIPELSDPAIARWTDKTRRFLTCPHCGVVEDTFIN